MDDLKYLYFDRSVKNNQAMLQGLECYEAAAENLRFQSVINR